MSERRYPESTFHSLKKRRFVSLQIVKKQIYTFSVSKLQYIYMVGLVQ